MAGCENITNLIISFIWDDTTQFKDLPTHSKQPAAVFTNPRYFNMCQHGRTKLRRKHRSSVNFRLSMDITLKGGRSGYPMVANFQPGNIYFGRDSLLCLADYDFPFHELTLLIQTFLFFSRLNDFLQWLHKTCANNYLIPKMRRFTAMNVPAALSAAPFACLSRWMPTRWMPLMKKAC